MYALFGEHISISPGSESTACFEGFCVNVGDPNHPSRTKYWLTSIKSEETEMMIRKSEES